MVCEVVSWPLGAGLGLWAHGVRQRQQRGPLEPGGKPQTVVFDARRYLCIHCGAILLVVPKGVVPRRHYAGSAIALSLALWALLGLCITEVRERVSPWQVVGAAACGNWASLRRWAEAIRRGALFAKVRSCPAEFSLRQVAERAAATLSAEAIPSPPETPPWVLAFFGGMRMA